MRARTYTCQHANDSSLSSWIARIALLEAIVKNRILLSIAALALAAAPGLRGQDSKLNTNLGAGITVPLTPLGRLTSFSANINAGAGYNFNKRHSIVGQFMWVGLNENRLALR